LFSPKILDGHSQLVTELEDLAAKSTQNSIPIQKQQQKIELQKIFQYLYFIPMREYDSSLAVYFSVVLLKKFNGKD
jgi:hypothetical protein